jgi:uncharacterized protein (DUF952 family)
MAELIYKICTRAEWERAVVDGVFRGSAVDRADGFIHFSQPDQVEGTQRRHFAGQQDLLRLGVDPETLGPALRYEVSRGGALFPHLYGDLAVARVSEVIELPPLQSELG